jgi:hypothetical protein
MKSAIGTLRRTNTSSSLITSDKSAIAKFGHGVHFFREFAAEQKTLVCGAGGAMCGFGQAGS